MTNKILVRPYWFSNAYYVIIIILLFIPQYYSFSQHTEKEPLHWQVCYIFDDVFLCYLYIIAMGSFILFERQLLIPKAALIITLIFNLIIMINAINNILFVTMDLLIGYGMLISILLFPICLFTIFSKKIKKGSNPHV